MKLIDEQQNIFIVGDFFDNAFDALFELTAVFASGYHSGKVEYNNAFVADRLRHDAKNDALRQSFCNRGFSDTRLADETRIVFRSAAQDLNHTLNFLTAAHNRIEFAFACKLGQIAAVLIKCRRFTVLCSASRLLSATGICISIRCALRRSFAHGSENCTVQFLNVDAHGKK